MTKTETDLVRTVHQLITSNDIVIFSKTYCPFSMMAKEIFGRMNKTYRVIELDKRSDGPQIQDVLQEMTGAKTVPRVFVRGQCLGGGMDVRSLFVNGKLRRIVGV
ncbi:monothiol glutaredoxin-S6-like [Ctenocephalides felis]|uniref:monothiol glutaredoxin-S6-like n=1 Tax=Ctenocephalides felis TaxID=7515 RepID=UPI000E6E1E7C|nr:monothiol glutaredoxin-S6-like [Ctenocephalides felis]